MNQFIGVQKTFTYTQINEGPIEEVFPLLCPVREKEWIDGWEYEMIYSISGFIEKDCVFTTPHHGQFDTVWQVTEYDPDNYTIEFLRVTPRENVVRINISLERVNEKQTKAFISYKYTSLNISQNTIIERDMENSFKKSMETWERSINHFLNTGTMLME